jgi:hypothetical protein
VELASFDPDTAREGDWLNYQASLDGLVRRGHQALFGARLHPSNSPVVNVDKGKIRKTSSVIRQVVRQFAAGGFVEPVTVTVGIAALGGAKPMLAVLAEHERQHDVAILLTAMYLANAQRPPIAVCPEDERLFVKVRRQQYCSRRCVNKANIRAYRQRLAKRLAKKKSPKRGKNP